MRGFYDQSVVLAVQLPIPNFQLPTLLRIGHWELGVGGWALILLRKPIEDLNGRVREATACLNLARRDVESIEIHDLVPRGHEITHELLRGVVARVDLREGPELGVRSEDEVHAAAGPLGVPRFAVAARERLSGSGR